jgi:hypothetical protein
MYKDHCPKIAEFGRQSPGNLFQVGLFVISTINKHFEGVGEAMDSYRLHGSDGAWFSAYQRRALEVWSTEAPSLHKRLGEWSPLFPELALVEVVQLPGVGITKGAFFLQLLGFEIGCLDRHNLALAGLDGKVFSKTPASTESLVRKIRVYTDLCRILGGAEFLWNQWCGYLANIRPKSFPSAEHVSRLHVEYIMGRN